MISESEWQEAFDADNFLRVEEDSPLRCQGVTSQGQCRIISVPGTHTCVQHGGAKARKVQRDAKARNYTLTKWRAAHEKADSNAIKDISEELGILRVLIETKLNGCQNDSDLMLQSQSISTMVMQAASLAEKLQAMETKLNMMLSTNQALQFADEIIEVIAKFVENAETRAQISDEIAAILAR